MINMTDNKDFPYFALKTRDGYEVKRLYQVKRNKDANPFLYAIIRRATEHPYVIAWDYDARNGTWGQGSYDWDTIAECEKHIKKHNRTARPVSPNSLLWVKSHYMERDGFGWYSTNDQRQLFSNAYRISKNRGDTLQFVTPSGHIIGTIGWHASRKISIYKSNLDKRSHYRVYADGHLEKIL